MKNTDAFNPDLTDIMGKAWKRDLSVLAAKQPVHASVCGWIVWAPWAHPAWQGYSLDVIHLRELPGMKPPIIHLPGATHEILLFALDPDWKLDPKAYPRMLQPINFAAQFMAESDEAAAQAAESAVRDILRGVLSPDTDFRSQWAARFGGNMLRTGLPAEGIARTGDTVIVTGTGAKNMRTITGPENRN